MGKDEKIIDDAPFEIPAFDEKEFIRKELISFKSTVVLFFFAIAVAALSFALWKLGPQDIFHADDGKFLTGKFLLHIVIALGLAFLLIKILLKIARINISHWKRREWVGTYLLFFMFWLGFFLLFTNPPATDAASPDIVVATSPLAQAPDQPVTMAAHISDNVGVDESSLRFCTHKVPDGQSIPAYAELSPEQQTACAQTWQRAATAAPIWSHTETFPAGRYAWFVVADDQNGQRNIAAGNFTVGSPFSTIDPPGDNANSQFIDSNNRFTVKPAATQNVRAVQYKIDGGNWTNMRPLEGGSWDTDPRMPGWHHGVNVVRLQILEQPQYLPDGDKSFKVEGASVPDPKGPYNVTVSTQITELNTQNAPNFDEKGFNHPGQAPGLGFLAIVAAPAIAFVAIRRRSRDA